MTAFDDSFSVPASQFFSLRRLIPPSSERKTFSLSPSRRKKRKQKPSKAQLLLQEKKAMAIK